ncbi:MAG: hypothetical protein J5X21_01555 [Candidatus Accumulibacter sp.]|nr:hypothetical protein [Candidatus Accumulibacter conexus]
MMASTDSADALARRIFVRYRAAGHLRLELPAAICSPASARSIEAALRRQEGVYRVALHAGERKLSVFYDEHACDAGAIARCLYRLLPDLPTAGDPGLATAAGEAAVPAAAAAAGRGERPAGTATQFEAAARRALRRLLRGMDRYPQLQGVRTRVQPVLESALSERAILNFLNDLLAFHLIRVHWDLITQQWLRDPLKFRSAWLTIFYLVFLLVRYRKGGDRK